MIKWNLITTAQAHLGSLKLWGISNAPTILMGVGITAQIAGMIMACVKTANMPDILEARNSNVDALKTDWIDGRMTDKEYRRALGSRYISFGLEVGRNYLVPFALEVFGVACILKGHGMMLTRCAALSTLLMEATERENRLEEAVRKEFGDEVLERLKRGEPVGEVTHLNPDGTVTKEPIFDELKDYDFVWGPGMKGFGLDNNANLMAVRAFENRGQMRQMEKGGLARINDIYNWFGAYDLKRSEYDQLLVGFPNVDVADYKFELIATPEKAPEGYEGAFPLRIHFIRKPVPCKDLQIENGFQRD